MDSYARDVVVKMTVWTICLWLLALLVVWNVMPAFWAREARIKTRVMLEMIHQEDTKR